MNSALRQHGSVRVTQTMEVYETIVRFHFKEVGLGFLGVFV